MASLPKELRQRKAHMHLTTPAGHAAGGEPMSAQEEAKQEKEDLGMSHKVDGESFLHHPQIKREAAIHQRKLVNDTAYFLHHPQIPPHGPKMPPAKPRESKKSK